MSSSQTCVGEVSQFQNPADLFGRNFKLPALSVRNSKLAAMRRTPPEKPRIAGSLSEASFGSARGMKSSDSVLPAYVAISADQLESLQFLGISFLGPSELSHETTATSPTCFASFADELGPIARDLKKLGYPGISDYLRRDLELPEAMAMHLTTQEKPRIAGSFSEASFRSARGMKSSDSVLPADGAILADQLECFGRGLGRSFFASSADESESFLIGPDLKKLRYPGIPGEMLHLSKGDTIPADGQFVFGYSVLIDASSLIGESKPIAVTPENPVLVAGTKVLDGQCTMMVTRVGMTIEHESLMGYIKVLRNRLGQNTIDYKVLVCFVAACGTMVINSNSLFVTVPLDEASVKHLQVTSSDFAGEGLGTWCLGYMKLDKEFSAEDPIPTSGYTCIGIVGSTIPPGIKESVAICRSAGINGGATEWTNWVLCPC